MKLIFVIALLIFSACNMIEKNNNIHAQTIKDTILNEDGFLIIRDSALIQVFEKISYNSWFDSYKIDTSEFTTRTPITLNRNKFKELTKEKYKCDYIDEEINRIADKDFENLQESFNNQKGERFANFYEIHSVSCGSPCHRNIMIDLRTGNLVEAPDDYWGLSCKRNSKLLITNLYKDELDSYYQINSIRREPEFYIFEGCNKGTEVFRRM